MGGSAIVLAEVQRAWRRLPIATSIFRDRYVSDLTTPRTKSRIKAVVACGNGTAGAFSPIVLEKIGVDVVPLDTELDHTFPRYNPNPEDLKMLHAIRDEV